MSPVSPALQALRALRAAGPAPEQAALPAGEPAAHERAEAAALALLLGHPRRAAEWARGVDPHTHAAALLRLGEPEAALDALTGQPDNDPRAAVLRARARQQQGLDEASARAALALARQAGDGPALVAAAVLHAETLLTGSAGTGDPKAALHALAAGLNVCERLGVETDPLLLAVLAQVQARVGSAGKAARTAQKALDRSWPGSPARVLALRALGRDEEARRERVVGELGAGVPPDLTAPPPPAERAP